MAESWTGVESGEYPATLHQAMLFRPESGEAAVKVLQASSRESVVGRSLPRRLTTALLAGAFSAVLLLMGCDEQRTNPGRYAAPPESGEGLPRRRTSP